MTTTTTPSRRRGLATWDPFGEMDSVLNRFNRWLGRPEEGERGAAGLAWAPVVDITEGEQTYRVQAEIPGVERDQVEVDVTNHVLTISGERREEREEDEETLHRVERSYGSFTRRFTLPDDADDEHIEARFRDGVLTVTIPKRPEQRPEQRRIEVQS